MDLVLGAGIVGVCTALHLQSRGRNVVLLDKNGIGNETSFGNAGLIERTDLSPRIFPRELSEILKYASRKNPSVNYNLIDIIRLSPWLLRYWHSSNPKNVEKIIQYMSPLFMNCLSEHEFLIKQANAKELLKYDGWLHLTRNQNGLKNVQNSFERAQQAGLKATLLDSKQISKAEPILQEKFAWGIHWQDSASITNPGQYVKKLYDLFIANGGAMIEGDARNLQQAPDGWQMQTNIGNIFAQNAVVALGPWSGDIFKRFGYKIPFTQKRGYHQTYDYIGKSRLKIPIIDADNGFVLAPMHDGTRLTTGVEFANINKKPTPSQLQKVELIAHSMLKMGNKQLEKPWFGSRPCTADMFPVIGAAPKHKGLWFNFGHAHHGMTLGPISGKLLAQIMVSQVPMVNSKPFSVTRFM